ncbi:MAG: CPXCG motif-containing cysteine-rich protein [Acidiferrobacterales bacterium]
MLLAQRICCPYCGETSEIDIDVSAGPQVYLEDCYVCCRPIVFRTAVDHDGNLLSVEVKRDDD